MDFIWFASMLILTLQFSQVNSRSKSKKHRLSSSEEESIENLLYYKDCQHDEKNDTTTTTAEPTEPPEKENKMPSPLRLAPQQPDCPFPKMCCALSCGNECGGRSNPWLGTQSEGGNPAPYFPEQLGPSRSSPYQSNDPLPQNNLRFGDMEFHSPLIAKKKRRSRIKPNKMLPPIEVDPDLELSGRRNMGPKEKIKSLISQDNDIRKILKDLVRVTMQKVDLLDMMNNHVMTTTEETLALDYFEE